LRSPRVGKTLEVDALAKGEAAVHFFAIDPSG